MTWYGKSIARDTVSRPKSVFEQLEITFTREEWARMNEVAGTNYPYPFADIIPFPAPPLPSKENQE
jgi:hypothetical protein